MLLRSLLRATAAASPIRQSQWQLSIYRSMAAKAPKKDNQNKGKKSHQKYDPKEKKPEEMPAANPVFSSKEEAELRRRQLAEDENNPALDVGPNGRPLFTSAPSLSALTKDDINTYFKFSMKELKEILPEGFPLGMIKEFEESCRSALMVRQCFIDLRDNFRRVVDPSLVVKFCWKQITLDGPVSCGKSIALAMLVHWVRNEGWLVLYVPSGRYWTHDGLFYKNPETGLWDTPLQAANILQDFLRYNKSCLQGLKCKILDPIPLGEGAGVGWTKGRDKMQISEEMTLSQLVEAGISDTHAATGVVARLRKELSEVTSVPVLIAIDQYNSWFTFTNFEEPVTPRSCRPIHAKELTTVNAFRSMMHTDMMVGAFSHSTAVGKLRQELPDVPKDARIYLPRYSLDEASAVCYYYLRSASINL
ncbi:hypothetical protein ACS0TY_008025 [Phlomoides rotata]